MTIIFLVLSHIYMGKVILPVSGWKVPLLFFSFLSSVGHRYLLTLIVIQLLACVCSQLLLSVPHAHNMTFKVGHYLDACSSCQTVTHTHTHTATCCLKFFQFVRTKSWDMSLCNHTLLLSMTVKTSLGDTFGRQGGVRPAGMTRLFAQGGVF